MLSALTFRLVTRAAPITKSATRPIVARFAPASHAPTRSFWSSSHVEEPAKAKATKKEAKGVKPKSKKRVVAKSGKPAAVKQKPKKKVKIPAELRPPKRPAAPYVLFYKEFLKGYERITSSDSLIASAVAGGQAWRALSDVQKAKRSVDLNITQTYIDLAKTKHEEHKVAVAEWYNQADPKTIAQLNKEAGKRTPKLRKPKSPDHIPRPMTSFLLYLSERRGEGVVGSAPAVARDTGEMWNSMTTEQKRPYQERADELRDEYLAKLQTASK